MTRIQEKQSDVNNKLHLFKVMYFFHMGTYTVQYKTTYMKYSFQTFFLYFLYLSYRQNECDMFCPAEHIHRVQLQVSRTICSVVFIADMQNINATAIDPDWACEHKS